MITQKMVDAARKIASSEGEAIIVQDAQIWTALWVGLPWCMTGVPDAAKISRLPLCLVDMMLDAAISSMSDEERKQYAYNLP